MIDKSLVKKRFKKSLKSYDENATIQKETAKKLISLLQNNEYNSIFEIGCATGILTKEIQKSLIFKCFDANDLVKEAKQYIDEIIPYNDFLSGDIEEIFLNKKYDLIISNACLQWCNDIERTTEKLVNSLTDNGIIAMTIFGDKNLEEITKEFGLENKNYSITKFKEFIRKYNILHYEEEIITQEFNSPFEILKHLKLTGVNAVKEMKLTKSKIESFEENYRKLHTKKDKVILTYNPVYIILSPNK